MLARHLLTLAATLLGCHAVLQKGPEFYFSGVSTFAHLDHHKWCVGREGS